MPAARRVLFVDQWEYVAGAQIVLLELIALSLNRGWDVHLAIPLGGALEARVHERFGLRVTMHALDAPRATVGRKTLLDIWRLARASRTIRFPSIAAEMDLVHVNGPRLYGAWRRANRAWKRPTVYHVHLHHSAIERAYIRSVIARDPCGVVVASSAEVARALEGWGGARPIALVRNGVPTTAARRVFEDRWTGGTLRWAVIGTLSPLKGQDLAIAAARALPNTTLYVIGGVQPTHAAWAETLRGTAPANVRFVGGVDDVPTVLAREGVQVVAITSTRAESFSLAAVEAMATSCITLFLRSAGMEEVCANTESERVEGVSGLVSALAVLRDAQPADSRRRAELQHQRVLAHYGPERFQREISAVYDSLL